MKKRPWTTREIKLLSEIYLDEVRGKGHLITKIMGRSYQSWTVKARELDLPRKRRELKRQRRLQQSLDNSQNLRWLRIKHEHFARREAEDRLAKTGRA